MNDAIKTDLKSIKKWLSEYTIVYTTLTIPNSPYKKERLICQVFYNNSVILGTALSQRARNHRNFAVRSDKRVIQSRCERGALDRLNNPQIINEDFGLVMKAYKADILYTQ